MNVLSLFDGISCGRIALERANIRVDKYYSSEIDKYSIQISNKNYPDIIRLGDVRKLDSKNLQNIDMVIGGSPCQSFSFAGKRKGMSTKENIDVISLEQYLDLKEKGFEFEGQSYLFWEYVRILKEIKAKYFLLENVKMNKKWKNIISKTLGVEPIEINSALVSGQNRVRLYWTNIGEIQQPEDKNIFISDIVKDVVRHEGAVDLNKKLLFGNFKSLRCQKRIIRNIRYFNEKANCITSSSSNNPAGNGCTNILCDSENGWRKLSAEEYEELQTLPINYTSGVSDTQRKKMIGNGWTVDIIAHIFSYLPKDIH